MKETTVRSLLVLALVGTLGLLVGCGSNGTPAGIPITIALTPSSASLSANLTLNITAVVSNDPSNKGVSWTLSGVGSLTNKTATSVTYNSPATVTTTSVATVQAASVASPAATATVQITVSPAGAANNVLPISVNGGPLAPASIYPNGAFASVTICVPGTATCQTIDDVLVDTGSFGLRLLGSQITIPLVPLNDGNGNTLNNCISFLDGSFLWGNVAPADIKLGGEVASLTSIQSIASPSFTIPSGCTGTNEDTQQTLGANGILGVGPEPFDCGLACDPNGGNATPPEVYYLCSASGTCNTAFVSCGTLCGDSSANQQVTNPVFNFATDNNGVLVDLPGVTGEAATVNGSMIFGIGTETNNALPSTVTVFTMDQNDNFQTDFNGQALTASFIDSGSNGLFFPDGSLSICASDSSWYCPANTMAFSATNTGANNATNMVNFSVDNFETVTAANPTDAAFSNLAGPNAGGFDWGLPFFYGRPVFTAIDGTTVGSIAGPFWAY
jgi:hypothetical protein